jgi:putative inorganic carbon (HCO3(-)) transporter
MITITSPTGPLLPAAPGPAPHREYPLEAPPALRILQYGAVAVVLVFIRGAFLNSERYDFPKEFVLHLVAAAAAGGCLLRARRLRIDTVDILLFGFLSLGLLSSWLAAENPWLAVRAMGLTLSGLAIYWSSRGLAGAGYGRALTACVAFAVILLAAVALLEAHGVVQNLSSWQRTPGGTLGNRNRMAHALAIGLPVLWFHALTVHDRARFGFLALGLAAVLAALVLSRCRAAWLAAAVGSVILLPVLALGWRLLDAGLKRRLGILCVALLGGFFFALYVPNQLQWFSSTPYHDSLRTLVDHESGSGRGRVIQYRNTLQMARAHPLLGVGPGNWMLEYPRYASREDPSYDPASRAPTTRLPQSDWVALAAERGFIALALLVLAGGVLVLRCLRRIRGLGSDGPVLDGFVVLSVVGTLLVLGVLDAVLLTPTATLLTFATLGALTPAGRRFFPVSLDARARWGTLLVVLLVTAVPVVHSGRQLWAGALYANELDPAVLERAARINPGDYYAHLFLAEAWLGKGRCDLALPRLESAHALLPTAPMPIRLRQRCDPPSSMRRTPGRMR